MWNAQLTRNKLSYLKGAIALKWIELIWKAQLLWNKLSYLKGAIVMKRIKISDICENICKDYFFDKKSWN